MSNRDPKTSFLAIHIFDRPERTAEAAAKAAAVAIRSCIKERGGARIMVGTGNSQLAMIDFLSRESGIDWSQVEAFHLDEYVGLPADHPASFRHWIRTRFAEKIRPKVTHYIEGDAANIETMIGNYNQLLEAAPVDLAFVGIGENGHIAFNDPHIADFQDPELVKRVTLDAACRQQQVGEGHFPDLKDVPQDAVTVTCSGLFRAARWICCVPDRRKAAAVKASLEGPVETKCPGSLVQRHPSVAVYLDSASSSLLSPTFIAQQRRVHEGASLSAIRVG